MSEIPCIDDSIVRARDGLERALAHVRRLSDRTRGNVGSNDLVNEALKAIDAYTGALASAVAHGGSSELVREALLARDVAGGTVERAAEWIESYSVRHINAYLAYDPRVDYQARLAADAALEAALEAALAVQSHSGAWIALRDAATRQDVREHSRITPEQAQALRRASATDPVEDYRDT